MYFTSWLRETAPPHCRFYVGKNWRILCKQLARYNYRTGQDRQKVSQIDSGTYRQGNSQLGGNHRVVVVVVVVVEVVGGGVNEEETVVFA